MTLDKAQEKLEKVLKEIENDDFKVSSITEISSESETKPIIIGSTIVEFNSEKIKNETIGNYEEDKYRASNGEVF